MTLTRVTMAMIGTLFVTGCALPPDGVSKQNIADYEVAVASIGCEMVGESDYLPVELQAGLTRQQATDLVAYHLGTEKAVELESGGVRLIVGECTPEPAA